MELFDKKGRKYITGENGLIIIEKNGKENEYEYEYLKTGIVLKRISGFCLKIENTVYKSKKNLTLIVSRKNEEELREFSKILSEKMYNDGYSCFAKKIKRNTTTKVENLCERDLQTIELYEKKKTNIFCPKCESFSIVIQPIAVSKEFSSRSELRKKSAVTNAANSIGRAGMIIATGGAWALTPEKSKYNLVEKGKEKTEYSTVATCQCCGHSWKVN